MGFVRPIGKQTLPKILGLVGGIYRLPLTPATTGVYFLVYRGRVVYVGQAQSIPIRIAAHVTEQRKRFDSAYAIPVRRFALNDVERAFITLLEPKYNGRFSNGMMVHAMGIDRATAIVAKLLKASSSPIVTVTAPASEVTHHA